MSASIGEVETPTVMDHGFLLTFVTDAPERCQVSYITDDSSCSGKMEEPGPAIKFHQLEVSGLCPGRTYNYSLTCGSASWPRFPWSSASITTLDPPPGRELFSFAVMNDVHAGEDISGVMIPPLPWLPAITPGRTWRFPVDNYWDFALRHTVRAINQSEAELVIVNGDLTSWFSPEEFALVKERLDRFEVPYYVSRGNHDRVEDYPEDYFMTTFELESSWRSVDHKGFHFIILDDNRLNNGFHGFPEEEFAWLVRDLAEHRHMVTFIFSHRHFAAGGPDIDLRIRSRLLKVIADNPQVAAVLNGHSHQARVTRVPELTGDVPYIEVPAVKDYPLGFGLVRVFEGGFMYNFMPTDCADCREWRHLTRGHYFGQAPRILAGELQDRNLVVEFSPEARELIGSRKNN